MIRPRDIHQCNNVMTKKLFTLMNEKQTNLALSADVTEATQLLDLADQLGPEICVLKTHIDTINDFTPALTQELKKLAKKHGFFLFEDRKFADIGHTAQNQYQGGVFEIAEWADIITAHALPGPGLIQGLAEIGLSKERGVLLLASMSSRPNFFNADYAQQTLQLAEAFPNFVMGFISQHRLSDDPRWIYLTPGVKLSPGTDHLGQGYITPEKAIVEQGTDIIIVGRGIIQAEDPLVEAQQYRARAWQAYLQRG